jgi:hypothetical protein
MGPDMSGAMAACGIGECAPSQSAADHGNMDRRMVTLRGGCKGTGAGGGQFRMGAWEPELFQ